MIKDIEKLTTIDDVLNSHLKFEKKYWIFKKKDLYPFCFLFKKEVFRIYSLLSLKKIIKEKIIVSGVKTHKQWIFDYEDFESSEIEKFKISFSPFRILEIKDRFFMISDFFSLTTEIFKENLKSSKRFHLKNKNYLENLSQTALYFDDEAFKKIYLRKLKDINVKFEIQKLLQEIKIINEEVEILSNLNKEDYIIKFKIKIKNDAKSLKELSTLLPFKKFTLNWLEGTFKKQIGHRSLSLIWDTIIGDLIAVKISSLTEDKFLNILKNKELLFFDIINKSGINDEEDFILKENDVNIFVEETYKVLINLYKNLNLTDEIKIGYGVEMYEIRKLRDIRVEMYSRLSKLYQLNYLNLLWSIKERLTNKKIYFPLFYDFRGRMYVHSSIGITNFKLSRYFFHYGWYNSNEITDQSRYNIEEIHKFKDMIGDIKNKLGIVTNINCISEGIFWCLIAVGKEYLDKSKISNYTEEIINKGFDKLMNENDEEDDEKWIIVEHYKSIMASFNKEKICKRFILKDATASFIQNAIRIIGPKNQTSLEFANLGVSDRWYDTYSLALKFWKNSLLIKNNAIEIGVKKAGLIEYKSISLTELDYFVRKTIKKPIMTDAYEASYYSKWEYFKKEINNEFKINAEMRSDLEYLFRNFNEFLENNFWDEHFLCDRSDVMINYITELLNNKKEILISSADSESNMTYYKFKDKVIDVTLTAPDTSKKSRKTKKYSVIDENEIDIKKIKTAIKPNWVHFSDAFLTRQINSQLIKPLLTVHDCFLVDCLGVSNFILKANKSFKTLDSFSIAKNREIIRKVKSIYIFF